MQILLLIIWQRCSFKTYFGNNIVVMYVAYSHLLHPKTLPSVSSPPPTYTCTHTYLHIPTHIYTYLHIPTHTYTYLHIPTHTYTYLHIPTHTYTYLHIPTYTHYNKSIMHSSENPMISSHHLVKSHCRANILQSSRLNNTK